MLVSRHAILKIYFESQSTLHKQLEGPVDSRVPDAWILRFDELMEIFRTQVFARIQKNFENPIAFCALLQALLAQVSLEDPLSHTQ